MDTPQLSQQDLDLLRKYDTPTICNVIELFGVQLQTAGYLDRRIEACFPKLPPMVGYATTATLRTAAPPAAGSVYGTLDDQVAKFAEMPQPVIVVFQDLDSPPVAATFGEVMISSYKAFGAAGLITSGAARDLEQVGRLDFPCFADGIICSHGYPHIIDLNVQVHVGGVMIAPGDLLHGDANGVTTIPHEIATEVAQVCEEFVAAEEVLIGYCRAGNVTVNGFSEARKELTSRVQAMRKRLGRK